MTFTWQEVFLSLDYQNNGGNIGGKTGSLSYLSLADDEEGVSSGSLSDDVLSVFIMGL